MRRPPMPGPHRKPHKAKKELRYIDVKKVKMLLGDIMPPPLLAKLIDVDLIALNNEACVRMGGGVKPLFLPEEHRDTVLGVADKMERYNHELAHNPQLMRKLSFYPAPFDLTIRSGSPNNMPRFHEAWSRETTLESTVQVYNISTCRCDQCYRDPTQHRAVLHIFKQNFKGHAWRISVPIQYLMKGFPIRPHGYMGYYHSFTLHHSEHFLKQWRKEHPTLEGIPPQPRYDYVGITSRNWLVRMKEHIYGIESGENKTFYNAWRQFAKDDRVDFYSELMVMNQTYEDIMDWEESRVDVEMAAGRALNMIPGGFRGIRELHKLGLLGNENPTLKKRDNAIAAAERGNPRAGVPNLLMSELWKDDEYAAKVICGGDGRLSVEQVRSARDLNSLGLPIEKIAEKINALNILQVERLLSGQTYSRIH
ncbi:MAG: hypothetical protein ABW082_11685 [Sedimenticola sp.]